MKKYTKIALTTLLAAGALFGATGSAYANNDLAYANREHTQAIQTFNNEKPEIKQTVNSALQARAGEYLRRTGVAKLKRGSERYLPGTYTSDKQVKDVIDDFGTLECGGRDLVRLGSYSRDGNKVSIEFQYLNKNKSISPSGIRSIRLPAKFANTDTSNTTEEFPAERVTPANKIQIERSETFKRDTKRPQRDYDPTSDANSYFIHDIDLNKDGIDDRVNILEKLSKTGIKKKSYTLANGKTGFVKQGIIAKTTYTNLKELIDSETRKNGKIEKHEVTIVIRPSEKVTGAELERRIQQYSGASNLRHMPKHSRLVKNENIFYNTPIIVQVQTNKGFHRRVELTKETFGNHYAKIIKHIKTKSEQRKGDTRWNLTTQQVTDIKRADAHIRTQTEKGFDTPSKLWSEYQSTFSTVINAKTLEDYATQTTLAKTLARNFNTWHSTDNNLKNQLERIVKSAHGFEPNNKVKIDSGDELYNAFMKIAELDGMKVRSKSKPQPALEARPTDNNTLVWTTENIWNAETKKYNSEFNSLHQVLAVAARADMRKGRTRVKKLHKAWTATEDTELFTLDEVVGRKNRRNVNRQVKRLLTNGINFNEYKRMRDGLETLRKVEIKSDSWTQEKINFLKAMNDTRAKINRSHGRYGKESSLRWLDQRFNPVKIAKATWSDLKSGKPLRILKAAADMYTLGFRPIKGEIGNKVFKWYNAGRAGTAIVETGKAIKEGRPGTAAANIADLLRMRGKHKSDDPVPTRGVEGGHTTPTTPFRRR